MSLSLPLPVPVPAPSIRRGLPPLLSADTPTDPVGWVARNRDTLLRAVTVHGAVVVRGLAIRDPDTVGGLFGRLGVAPVTEREGFAPRRSYAHGVYSSSEWPSNQPMCMHHELSYTLAFPSLLLFACLTTPATGGATALADSAAVFDALPPAVSERFFREGWLLARSYGNEVGPTTAEAFGTDDPRVIEQYCRANAISTAWQPDGTLRTRQRRSAVLRDPVTGRHCWFNQIAFLNEWTIDPEVRDYLIDEYGADGLPFNTFHGNGDPLSPATVESINDVYAACTVSRPWRAGDLLIVDNLRTAHSREPYRGLRDVVVAMGSPLHPHDCSATIEVTLP